MNNDVANSDWPKRDVIIAYEKKIKNQYYQKFETPRANGNPKREKFFATFPYPYMNGTLHLGHAYTISKVEFTARFQEMLGKNVLFPFAFHGTGMPIVACAQKVEKELAAGMDPKNPDPKSQIEILLKMNVPHKEIPLFRDPYYWLKYFPQRAKEDLLAFGACVDLSRSFITTDLNPYYDSFVKWQFHHLNRKALLHFGKKPVIYSIRDGQACSDHDRSQGEEVGIKEYFVMKLRVKSFANTYLKNKFHKDNIYVLVGTTRLETMYGLQNLWINSSAFYSILKLNDNDEYWIVSQGSVEALRYQLHQFEEIDNEILGKDLIETQIDLEEYGDLGQNKKLTIPIWSADHVDAKKGTGIVASVPAHSVADYQSYKDQWFDLEFKPVIACGDKNIPKIIQSEILKGSQPHEISKKIFRIEKKFGQITQGKYQGLGIDLARDKLAQDLIEENLGFFYYEPEDLVVSRSGDQCIVAKVDQWFINYGDKDLTQRVNNYLILEEDDNNSKPQSKQNLETYNPQVRNQFIRASNWIGEWPCSRAFGLGTQLLDTNFVIDSLSDSTIYMAYYTIAHLLDKIPIKLVQDTEISHQLWDYIFLNKDLDQEYNNKFDTQLKENLEEMHNEFQYWYPVDLRVSGKDLIGNHLTMSLYNHAAMWPQEQWPRAFYANGYLLLNGEKMSKSKGNFMTMEEAVTKYGSDATRIALAEAGSGMDDANFTESNAEAAILKLTNEREWIIQLLDKISNLASVNGGKNEKGKEYQLGFWDQIFLNDTKKCQAKAYLAFQSMEFQKAIVEGFYNLLKVRDEYMKKCVVGLASINSQVIQHYLMSHLRLIYPICPCYSQYLWQICSEKLGWPKDQKVNQWIMNYWFDETISQELNWYKDRFTDNVSKVRSTYDSLVKRFEKKNKVIDPHSLTLTYKILTNYSEKEQEILKNIKSHMVYDGHKIEEINWKKIIGEYINTISNKKEKGFYAKFISFIKTNCENYGSQWIELATSPTKAKGIQEYNLVIQNLGALIPEITNINIERFQNDEKTQFRYGPWFPIISIN